LEGLHVGLGGDDRSGTQGPSEIRRQQGRRRRRWPRDRQARAGRRYQTGLLRSRKRQIPRPDGGGRRRGPQGRIKVLDRPPTPTMSTDSRESRKGDLIEKIIKIRRCAAVVKGGRRFSFNGMVVVGNGRGKVGCGYGKANEVPPAVEKATKDGERNMMTVPLEG